MTVACLPINQAEPTGNRVPKGSLRRAGIGARLAIRSGGTRTGRDVQSPAGGGVQPVRLAFDEMKGTDGEVRPAYAELAKWLGDVRPDVLEYRRKEAELLFRRIGITFAVYGEADAQERLIPFDVIPRILSATEWDTLRRGLEQRVKAINAYLRDIYGRREILRAGIVPEDLVFQNPVFRPEMNGQKVPHDIYVHIAGIDVVRVDADTFYVLEDNARTPVRRLLHAGEPRDHDAAVPGAVLAPPRRAGRELSRRAAGDAEIGRAGFRVRRSDRRAAHARRLQLAPITSTRSWPTSSASSWSRAATSSSRPSIVYMRTTAGAEARRRDLPPHRRRLPRSAGLPPGLDARRAGLMSAYQAGNVTLANAVGTGIADDKAVYSYMPEIMKFYLGEEPILKNVPTWRCREPEHLAYVLDHLDELVVKEVHGSGGYGMLIGPKADKAQIEAFRTQAQARSARASSRSRRWRCRPARPASRTASRRATSTCGRSC